MNRCILSKLKNYVPRDSDSSQLHELQHSEPVYKVLTSKANFNQSTLIHQLIINYDQLPSDLQYSLSDCVDDKKSLLKMCEEIYGIKNCELLNAFTVQRKCPEGFERADLTRCVRKCEKGQKIINQDCDNDFSYFYDKNRVFKTKEECENVQNTECTVSEDYPDSFVEDCKLGFKKVSVLCIPLCMNEMDEELLDRLRQHPDYCVVDSINQNLPLFNI